MLNTSQIVQIKASIPILQDRSADFAAAFLKRLAEGSPELLNIFSRARLQDGEEQKALAEAVLTFAQNIEFPDRIAAAARQIAERHTALGVRADQYPVISHHLLEAIRQTLGASASAELIAAWAAACSELSELLSQAGEAIQGAQAAQTGSWTGWRPFECVNRIQETADVVSFYFRPADGGPLPDYAPGQYITLRVHSKALQITQQRHYTLSQPAGTSMLRITVKAIAGRGGTPDGLVSNILHRRVKVGDTIEFSAPAGSFTLGDLKSEHPAVMIAAGIGITPIAAMLSALAEANPLRRVHFLYSTQNLAHYPLKRDIDAAFRGLPNAAKGIFFTHPGPEDQIGRDYNATGRITPSHIRSFCQDPDADFYLCGPAEFMRGVSEALRAVGVIAPRIHMEDFSAAAV